LNWRTSFRIDDPKPARHVCSFEFLDETCEAAEDVAPPWKIRHS